jgi:pimeloyl-ACP methyl ester carboxylesterase
VGAFADRSWVSADGLRLYARDYPPADGPARLPAICLHGLTRNSRDFEGLAPRLAATGRRVLALDVRGRGRSDWDPNPMNYQQGAYVQDVIALMTEAGVARAQFVGTSMGGMMTMLLASLRPDMVAGAVINDIGPELLTQGLQRISSYVGLSAEAAGWAEAANYVRTTNGPVFPRYGPEDWDRMARRVFRQDGSGRPVLDYDPAIAVPFRQAGDPAFPPIWPLWGVLVTGRPVLVVRGAISDLLSHDTFELMLQSSPTVAGVEVPDVGHAPTLDEPQALAAIDAFFAAQP